MALAKMFLNILNKNNLSILTGVNIKFFKVAKMLTIEIECKKMLIKIKKKKK